jgi:Tol biopolymer transport system component
MTFENRGIVLLLSVVALGAWGPRAQGQEAGTGFAPGCFGPWEPATNLDDPSLSTCDPGDPSTCINTPANEFHPAISPDGLSLYITTNRPGGAGLEDIWVVHRASPDARWGRPQPLGPSVDTAQSEYAPNLSPDGHWLLFTRADRPFGVTGPSAIYASYREDVEDDFGWQEAAKLAGDINDPRYDANAPRVFVDRVTASVSIYFNSILRPGSVGDYDEYVSTWWPQTGDAGDANAGRLGRHFLENGSFPVGVDVTRLNSTRRDSPTAIRGDGLEMLVTSNRDGGLGNLDIWVSTRASTFDEEWSTPVDLGPAINSGSNDGGPSLSADGTTLYFYSDRTPAGFPGGGRDLYVARRAGLCSQDEQGSGVR